MQLYNDDCIKIMQSLPEKSVDLILTDPPFGTTHNRWDSVIPFENLWEGYERVIKDNGAIILFGQGLFSSELACSNKKMFRYRLVWEKTKAGGFLNARRMPLQAHEDILVFYKKLPTYNPQMVDGKPYSKKAVTNGDGKNYGKFDRVGTVYNNNGKYFPRSVIKFANGNRNSLHPTQKPVELLEYLIKTYSNEGDVVLDSCMGSGSTGCAALGCGRDFIGIELDLHYYDIAKERIEKYEISRK